MVNKLTPRSQEIYNSVLIKMQEAEELGGPDDYAGLMEAISAEACARRKAFIAIPENPAEQSASACLYQADISASTVLRQA